MASLRTALLVAAAITAIPANASKASAQTEDRRSAKQIADSVEIAQVARTVTKDAVTDSARAALLYAWVAQGVKYDVPSFLSGKATDDSAEGVYRGRLAVCAGYVALYARMGMEVGLQTETIHGYAKGFNYVNGQATAKPNHSWLAVKIDKSWKLVDPTWGSGVVSNGKFVPHFIWDYFMVAPEALQLSHFPEESSWQLVKKPLSRKDFERMSSVPRTLVALGFDPETLRKAALEATKGGFPIAAEPKGNIRILSAPALGTIAKSTNVAFDLIWPGVDDVALVTGGAYTALAKNGERFQGHALAAGSDVMLVGRRGDAAYETLLYYKVQ